MHRPVLVRALFLIAMLCFSLCVLAQERPRTAVPRQAYGIDIETHVDLLIGAEAAPGYLHQLVMVCGLIADTYFERSDVTYSQSDFFAGQRNTYLYFDKPRGEHDFVAIVKGTVRKDLPMKPESLEGHRACVFGTISTYRQRAAMRIERAEQLATREPSGKTPD